MTTFEPVPGHKTWCALNDEYVVDTNKPRECSCQRAEDLAWLERVFTYFAKSPVELSRSARIMRELTFGGLLATPWRERVQKAVRAHDAIVKVGDAEAGSIDALEAAFRALAPEYAPVDGEG